MSDSVRPVSTLPSIKLKDLGIDDSVAMGAYSVGVTDVPEPESESGSGSESESGLGPQSQLSLESSSSSSSSSSRLATRIAGARSSDQNFNGLPDIGYNRRLV